MAEPLNSLHREPGLCLYCGSHTGSEVKLFCCNACEDIFKLDEQISSRSRSKNFEANIKAFSYLDQDAYKKKYLLKDNAMLFYIEGLHCSSCVHLLEQLSSFDEEIIEARVQFGDSTLYVEQKKRGSWARVAATISELGYRPSPLSPTQDPKQQYQIENREALKRLAVAGACAGNMMLFVVPIYAGLDGSWAKVFNWMSFLLFLPILFYSAKPFYQGAWNFLKYQTTNVDLPIVVAFLSGFLLSTYNLITGTGPVYYDSTASFLFLILSSRYLLKRVQQKYLNTFLGEQTVSPIVKVGDILELLQGQKIPVDGKLLSDSAEIDLSLFNGESLPQLFHKDMRLLAGTTLLSQRALIQVEKMNSDTRLGQLVALLRTEATKKARFVSLTDRCSQWLILTVFSLAFGYVAMDAAGDFQTSMQRALALIVVACPCALAFGTPLAYGLAIKKARSLGIIVKNSDVFEKILRLENIFFDKTGTLTEGILSYVGSDCESLSEDERKIILSLESISYHPIAFALRRAWNDVADLPKLENHHEILGRGVEGTLGQDHYSLISPQNLANQAGLVVEFRKNNKLLTVLHFKDKIRVDSPLVVSHLKNYNLGLLSGDHRAEVEQMATACGLGPENCLAELSPEKKLEFVQKFPHTCMIGDGANDSLALKAADVGIAVKGSVDLSLASADVYLSRGGLSAFLDLLDLARRTRKTIYRNLLISFTYNTIGGILALSGFINPMVAAILMPISSMLLVLSSLGDLR